MDTHCLIYDRLVVYFEVLGNTEKCVDDFCPSNSCDLSLLMHECIIPVEFLSIQKVNEMLDCI